jgi:DNA-binding transcriptional MocR family regulator
VVVQAYQRLLDEGLLHARTGAGTVVTASVPARATGVTGRRHATDRLRLPLPTPAGVDLDLSPGVPDLSAFPRAAWLRAERAVLAEVTGPELGYGDPGGTPRLRRELVGWLARTRGGAGRADDVLVVGGVAASGLVIEDDYDAEHRYDRAPVAALQPSAPERIAYTGSISKSLAPGMRLGWLIAPPGLRSELLDAKHASDLGNPALPQLVLARLLASGDYERHLRTVRARQRRRRDALLAGLRTHLPEAGVEGVAAGLHLLITLPYRVDDIELAERIAAAGVLVHPQLAPASAGTARPGPGLCGAPAGPAPRGSRAAGYGCAVTKSISRSIELISGVSTSL